MFVTFCNIFFTKISKKIKFLSERGTYENLIQKNNLFHACRSSLRKRASGSYQTGICFRRHKVRYHLSIIREGNRICKRNKINVIHSNKRRRHLYWRLYRIWDKLHAWRIWRFRFDDWFRERNAFFKRMVGSFGRFLLWKRLESQRRHIQPGSYLPWDFGIPHTDWPGCRRPDAQQQQHHINCRIYKEINGFQCR